MTHIARSLLVLAAAGWLAGCGITAEDEAHRVEPPAGPYSILSDAPDGATDAGPVPVTLYMTRDGALAAVTRPATREPTLASLFQDLLAGPTDTEQDQGISSALPGASVFGEVTLSGGRAEVDLAASLDGTGRSDAVLAFGQVVCTLDARPEVNGVVFIREGDVVGVPRGDGALHKGPLTSSDYDCPTAE
jgi:spore germination protein GerM